MSDKGFDVDTEAVREVVGKLRAIRSDFDEVAGYTAEADPDWWMWGATGLLFSQQYDVSATGIRIILDLLGPAVEGLVTRIEQACDDYDTADVAASDDVNGAGDDLSGSSHD